jgi:hypothetical protein
MAGDGSQKPVGLNIDIGEILRDATKPQRRRNRTRTTSSNDMDAALRRAVRVELAGVERALKDLAVEVGKLRRSNDDLAARVARLSKG